MTQAWGTAGRIRISLIALILTGAAESHGQTPKQGNTKSDRNQGSLKVQTMKLVAERDDFWADPQKGRRQVQTQLTRSGQEALLTEAPDEVRLGVRNTLPVVVLRTAKIANAAGTPFARTAVLTAVDVDNNVTYAALAITPTERHTAPAPRGNAAPLQEGMIGEGFTLDARRVLELPWEPAKYIVTLILRETPAQRLPVRLVGAEGSYKDPEVEKYKEQLRKQADVPAVFPAPHPEYAMYERRPETPEVPAEPGIALSAPRVLPLKDARECVLRGAFRLKVLPKHVVPAAGETGGEKIQEQFRGKSLVPTAVVPITVVGTGSVAAVPMIFRFLVPTFDPVTPGEGGMATGSFAIDLQQIHNVLAVEQTLFLYAFSGEEMTGPIPIGFVR